MALDSWDWFIELADKDSFTKAANSLQISQQTLSARLAALEKDVDAKLVVRGNPLSLTPAGQAFLMYAREQSQAQSDMLRQIGEVTGGGAGELKVGISHMRSRVIMPQVIKLLHERLPKVTVSLIEGTNRELVHMLERGEVDATVARFGTNRPGLTIKPLLDETVVMIADPDLLARVLGVSKRKALSIVKKEGLKALKDCPFVLGMLDDITGRIAYSELRNAGINPKPVATSESLASLINMAAIGVGAAFTPTNALDALSNSTEHLVRIPLSKQATYTISLGTPELAEPWNVMDEFEVVLREVVES